MNYENKKIHVLEKLFKRVFSKTAKEPIVLKKKSTRNNRRNQSYDQEKKQTDEKIRKNRLRKELDKQMQQGEKRTGK